MIMKHLSLKILFLFLGVTNLKCQDSINLIKYYNEFEFEKGVYRTYKEFRENAPSIQSNYELSYYADIIPNSNSYSNKKVYVKYYNPVKGIYEDLYKSDIWGFSDGRIIYKLVGSEYFTISTIKPITWVHKTYDKINYKQYPNPHLEENVYSVSLLYDLENDSVYDSQKVKKLESIFGHRLSKYDTTGADTCVKKTIFIKIEEYNSDNPIFFPINKQTNSNDFIFY
jgi:hypothetical protein